MQILTRRPSEAIIIELPTGETIKVAVLSVKPNLVRIGADAPGDIKIIKKELLEDFQIEKWMPTKQQKKTSD
jgi:carbon storage regulator CsrA